MKVTDTGLEPPLPLLPLSLLSPDPLPQPLATSASERATAAMPLILFVLLFMVLPLLVSNAGWRELGIGRSGPIPVVTPGSGVGDPRQDSGGHHRGDEQQPDDDVDDVDRHALQAQGTGDDADEQDPGDDAVEL